MEPADVYCMWIDECARINKQNNENVEAEEPGKEDQVSYDLAHEDSASSGSFTQKKTAGIRKNKIRKLSQYD